MDKFGYPTNIKQIGDVDNNLRIYIEDYVYSYLLQYGESGGDEERISALIGRCMIIDGQTVLFINGAIQGKYAEQEKGILVFGQKCLDYIENQCEKYFKGLEIVGWMQSQPNYGNFLSASYANYHITNFKKPYQVMFVTDPIEKINSFFIWNEDRTDIQEADGFFIYYEKNKSMHNYILDNKIVKLKQEEITEPVKMVSNNTSAEDNYELQDEEPIKPEIKKAPIRKIATFRKTNIVASVCALLFVVSFVMGAGLIKNEERIAKLEGDINTIRTAYNGLVTYINENGAKSVFASQSTPMANIDKTSMTVDSGTTDNSSKVQTTTVVEPKVDTTPVPTPEPTAVPTENAAITNTQPPEKTPAPTKTPKPATANKVTSSIAIPDTYVIQQGDSLIDISKRFYGTINMQTKIMDINQITNPNKIYFGMVIKLPAKN